MKHNMPTGRGPQERTLMKMLDAIEEQDDVNEVYANYDIPDDVLERIAG